MPISDERMKDIFAEELSSFGYWSGWCRDVMDGKVTIAVKQEDADLIACALLAMSRVRDEIENSK